MKLKQGYLMPSSPFLDCLVDKGKAVDMFDFIILYVFYYFIFFIILAELLVLSLTVS